MFHATSIRLAIAAVLLAAAGIAAPFAPAEAQNSTARPPPGNVPQTSPPGGGTNGTKPSANDPGRPADPDGSTGGQGIGLPDAVTVLDILRRLPRWPDGGGGRVGIPGDDAGPGRGTPPGPSGETPQPSPRVVVIPTGVPFVPTPEPRGTGSPAPVVGAVVPETLPREVLVTLSATSTADTVYELSQDLGLEGQTVYISPLLGVRVVRFYIPDTRSVADVLQQLASDARVEIAEPHYVYTSSQGAAKPLPVPQYAPGKLKLAEAHKLAQGKRVKVAVIDTAVDTSHPAFKGGDIKTFDALGGSKPKPERHGTAIAGIVGAREALEGVAPEASLYAVRAFTSEKDAAVKSYTLAVLKGLDWAVTSGARVVNMSFAGPRDPILEKALAAAEAQGIVLVAAAGNGGPDAQPAYPAAYDSVMAVTATDDGDALYKDANRGAYIAVAAPGVDIIAAAPGGAYDISSGTSLAAAHVSGIAALVLERNPKATAKDIRDMIAKSAKKLEGRPASEVGAGVADAAAALGAAE